MHLKPEIIYSDRNIVVLNKPAGLQVHGARISEDAMAKRAGMHEGSDARWTLADWLMEQYPEMKKVGDDPDQRPGIVHRLDKETSGILVTARNQATFEYLKDLFKRHEMKKKYLAIVVGVPKNDEGVIDAPIGIKTGTMKRSVRSPKMAKAAITEYKVLKTIEAENARGEMAKYSLLEVSPRTGRTHQIRVHLASMGHSVVGDRMYGPAKQPAWAGRLMLHAFSIEFTAPDGKRVKFEAEPKEKLFT